MKNQQIVMITFYSVAGAETFAKKFGIKKREVSQETLALRASRRTEENRGQYTLIGDLEGNPVSNGVEYVYLHNLMQDLLNHGFHLHEVYTEDRFIYLPDTKTMEQVEGQIITRFVFSSDSENKSPFQEVELNIAKAFQAYGVRAPLLFIWQNPNGVYNVDITYLRLDDQRYQKGKKIILDPPDEDDLELRFIGGKIPFQLEEATYKPPLDDEEEE